MAIEIGSLIIEMSANIARLRQDMDQAQKTVGDAMGKITGAVDLAKKALGLLGVGVTIAGFAGLIRNAIDTADAVGKMAEKAGLGVEEFSALAYAMQRSDVPIDTLQASIKKLSVSLAEASAGNAQKRAEFRALNVEFQDAAGKVRTVDKVLLDLADTFAKHGDDPVKTAYAIALMGKNGSEMIPGLNKGRQALEELMQQARDTGKVIDKEFADQADRFNKNLDLLTNSGKKLGMSLARDLLPNLTAITNAMTLAKKESGTLMALWVGLGGIGQMVFGKEVLEPLEAIDKQIADVQEKLANFNPLNIFGPSKKQLDDQLAALQLARKTIEAADRPAAPARSADPAKPTLDPSALGGNAEKIQKFLEELQKEAASDVVSSRYDKLLVKAEAFALANVHGLQAQIEFLNKAEGIARQVKLYDESLAAAKRSNEQFDELVGAIDAANTAFEALIRARRMDNEQAQFELSIVGLTNDQRAIATVLWNAERQAIEARVAASKIADADERQRRMAEIDAAKALTDSHVELLQRRQAAEREWSTGATRSFDSYLNSVAAAAAQSERLFTGAFRNMEDALVNFIKTGKLDFRSLADSIITDLIRIQVQNSIMKPLVGTADSPGLLSKGLSALFSSFGGGKAGGGPLDQGKWYIAGEYGPEPIWGGGPGAFAAGYGAAGAGAAGGGGGITVNQPLTINAPGADASTVQQIRALMPAFLAENKRVIEGVMSSAMVRGGGRFA